jgi:uncharacterized PurR-regulated membrane protein YhhQ (DUF165 family)
MFKNTNRILIRNLVIFHTLIIAVSNYLVTIRFNLFSEKINILGWETSFPLAAAAFTFPLVVVASDLTVRMVGKQTARAVVAMVLLILKDPHAIRVGLASGSAYAIGTMLDVYVMQWIREKWSDNWWLAPAMSTVAANVIDTYTFFYTAFYPQPWVHAVAFNNTLVKIIVGFAVFLPAYGMLLMYLQKKLKRRLVG